MEDWCPNQPKGPTAAGGRVLLGWYRLERADTSERRVTNSERRVTPRKDEADGLQPGPPSCFAHVQSLSVCISSTEPVAVSK